MATFWEQEQNRTGEKHYSRSDRKRDGLMGGRTCDAVVTPAAILASHSNDQLHNVSAYRWPPRVNAMFRLVELASDELVVPGKGGFELGYGSHLFERPTTDSFANFQLEWLVERWLKHLASASASAGCCFLRPGTRSVAGAAGSPARSHTQQTCYLRLLHRIALSYSEILARWIF
jgi:hypothetical protein